jgi:chromosome segregation ATPase
VLRSGACTAEDQRADALRQAKADREALTVAERRVRDAERELDEKTTAAWRKVVETETAKGAAEGQRDEAKANLRAYVERFDDLAKRANELTEATNTAATAGRKLEAARARTGPPAADGTRQAARQELIPGTGTTHFTSPV